MTFETLTPAAPGGPNVVAFPRRRSLSLCASLGSIMRRDGYDHCFAAVHLAAHFDERGDRPTLDVVREIMRTDEGDGPAVVARMLEQNAAAIDFLRSSLAYLVAADARIATAADSLLAEVGR